MMIPMNVLSIIKHIIDSFIIFRKVVNSYEEYKYPWGTMIWMSLFLSYNCIAAGFYDETYWTQEYIEFWIL